MFGAVRKETFTRTVVFSDPSRRIVSMGHRELTKWTDIQIASDDNIPGISAYTRFFMHKVKILSILTVYSDNSLKADE